MYGIFAYQDGLNIFQINVGKYFVHVRLKRRVKTVATIYFRFVCSDFHVWVDAYSQLTTHCKRYPCVKKGNFKVNIAVGEVSSAKPIWM